MHCALPRAAADVEDHQLTHHVGRREGGEQPPHPRLSGPAKDRLVETPGSITGLIREHMRAGIQRRLRTR
jgi:hypothetical protein